MEDVIVEEIVEELNKFEAHKGSDARNIGVIVVSKLKSLEFKEQDRLLSLIKKSDKLKVSPQFAYECSRMVNKFREMLEDDWKPLENLSISHYFELSRYKIDQQMLNTIIKDASEEAWSIRQMKDRVKEYKGDLAPEDRKRKELFKRSYAVQKKMTNEELQVLVEMLEEKYGRETKELESQTT